MEEGTRKQEIQIKKVERRLLDKNFLFVQRIQLAASAKQAAAKSGYHERSNKENQIKRKSGC